jgi:hypothetical protein
VGGGEHFGLRGGKWEGAGERLYIKKYEVYED